MRNALATIIRTWSEEDEELVELFCECLYYVGPRRSCRTPYSVQVLKRALELFKQNKLAGVVERDKDSMAQYLQLATPQDISDIPFNKNLNAAITGLEMGGIRSIPEILDLSDAELLGNRFPNLGKAALKALDKRLSEMSLRRGVGIKGLEEEPWPEED